MYAFNEAGTRAVLLQQPEPFECTNAKSPNLPWWCYAHVAKKRTGLAIGWQKERGGPFRGSAEVAALAERSAFIDRYFVTKVVAPPKRERPPPRNSELPKRKAAKVVEDSSRSQPRQGPLPGQGRPGPGRGHKYEAAAHKPHLTSDEVRGVGALEPDVSAPIMGNWLQKETHRRQQQSAVIGRLTGQVAAVEKKLAENEAVLKQQAETIDRLRQRVSPPAPPQPSLAASPLRPLQILYATSAVKC